MSSFAIEADATALDVYASGLRSGGDLRVRTPDGRERPLALGRWMSPVTAADELALSRVSGPVLDVGCGPGRHVHALARRGVLALGLDVCPEAVSLARRRGIAAVEGSVFSAVPGAGTWGSALLLDGNVGIGGHPGRLLARVSGLLREDGRIIAEVERPGVATHCQPVRLIAGEQVSEPFAWAVLGIDGLAGAAAGAGLRVAAVHVADDRHFAELVAAAP